MDSRPGPGLLDRLSALLLARLRFCGLSGPAKVRCCCLPPGFGVRSVRFAALTTGTSLARSPLVFAVLLGEAPQELPPPPGQAQTCNYGLSGLFGEL